MMREKRFKRCLAFMTAFVLVLSNFSTVAAASADGSNDVQSVVESETSAGVDTEDVSVPEVTEESATEAASVAEDTEKEDTTEAPQITQEELPEETEDAKVYYGAATDLLSDVMPDSVLRNAVAVAVNKEKDGNTITIGDLETFEEDLDLSGDELKAVENLAGLNHAILAKSINLSGCTGITTIKASTFQGCGSATSITIPHTISAIEEKAFQDCASLVTFNVDGKAANLIPEDITSIGQLAFSGCTSLTGISVNCSKVSISMFSGCTKLETVTVGSNVKDIDSTAFLSAGISSTDGLTVDFKNATSLESIGTGAFREAKFKSTTTLDLSSCKKLGLIDNEAFYAVENLEAVKVPSTINSTTGYMTLGARAFGLGHDKASADKNLGKLKAFGTNLTGSCIDLPAYITSVGEACFYGQTDITSVTFPNNAIFDTIPDYLFDGCTGLSTVNDFMSGNKIKTIGNCAFRCTGLYNTDFLMQLSNLETIGTQKITVAAKDEGKKENWGVSYRYAKGKYTAENTKNEEEKVISLPLGGISTVNSVKNPSTDPVTGNKIYNNIVAGSEVFTGCPLTSISIPSSVTTIGARAFYNRTYDGSAAQYYKYDYIEPKALSLTWNSTKNINRHVYAGAFQGNKKLATVELPTGGDLELDAYCFAADTSLKSINASDGQNVLNDNISKIGRGAFFACMSLESIEIKAKAGKPIVLEPRIFEKCTSLETAVLPQAITEIPNGMFYDVPLKTFKIGNGGDNSVTTIGELAFMGNQFEPLDLQNYKALSYIKAGAFSHGNSVGESSSNTAEGEWYNNAKEKDEREVTHGKGPQMTTVKLPQNLTELNLGTAAFYNQSKLITMGKGDSPTESLFMIPSYMVPYEGACGMFSRTNVYEVQWEVDNSSNVTTGRWTIIPQAIFADCKNIKNDDVRNVLPGTWNAGKTVKTCNYLQKIDMGAFFNTNIKKVDLSGYSNLETIGTDKEAGCLFTYKVSLPSGSEAEIKAYGAFAYSDLTSVVLPTHDKGLLIGIETFMEAYDYTIEGGTIIPASATYNLGSATKIEKRAFKSNDGVATIKIPDGVTVLSDNVFENCISLENVDFGAVTIINKEAFKDCAKLKFSTKAAAGGEPAKNYQLPATLQEIGNSAFKNDTSLGEAVFGENLTKIDANAFQDSGLTDDLGHSFSNAKALYTIGGSAFKNTKIKTIDMTNTIVGEIATSTFEENYELISAKFNRGLKSIAQNALAVCPNLGSLTIYDHTTLDKAAFSTIKYQNTANEVFTAQKSGQLKLDVKAVNDNIVVPLGDEVVLPYYVFKNEGGTDDTAFDYVQIGDSSTNIDSDISDGDNLKITTLAKYFCNTKSTNVDAKYLDSTKYTGTLPNSSVSLELIKARGEKATSGSIPFIIVSNPTYFTLGSNRTLTVPNNGTTYKITVKEVPFHADIYDKNPSTVKPTDPPLQPLSKEQSFHAISNSLYQQFYYDIVRDEEPEIEDNIVPDTKNLVVVTDNPGVVYPSKTSNGAAPDGNSITVDTSPATYYLIFKGTGKATITVYPQGHEKWKRVFNYNVDSDPQSGKLVLGFSTYKAESGEVLPATKDIQYNKGDKINLFASCTNWFGETATTLEDLAKITNQPIEFYIDNDSFKPYISVDQNGVATVLSNAERVMSVTVKAKISSAKGDVPAILNFNIAKGVPATIPGDTVTLYSDNARKTELTPQTNIDMNGSAKLPKEFFFNISNSEGMVGEYFDCCDVVVTTNNPAVLYPAESSSGAEAESYQTKKGGSDIGKPNTAAQRFTLIARNNGVATITVYPQKYPTHVKTYTFIVQGSSNVDAVPGAEAVDKSTGATVKIIKPGQKDLEGEVTYVAPKAGEVNVRVPDTVTINDIKYKVTTVPDNAFKGNKTVKSVSIGNNVTSIGKSAFSGCSALTSVTIPGNAAIKTISASAFQNCTSLAAISIPKSVTKIDAKAFSGCKKLTRVTFDPKAAITQIGNSAFQNCTSLTQIDIPSKVTKIGTSAFSGCKKLVLINVLSSKVKSVGKNAFKNINKKAQIKVPKKKYSKYKKLFKKGQKKSVKIVKK